MSRFERSETSLGTFRAAMVGVVLGALAPHAAWAETATPGFCEAAAESFRVRALNGLHRVVREAPDTLRIEPLGLKAVCTFIGGERPEHFETAEDLLDAAQKPDSAWLDEFSGIVGADPKVTFNDVRPSPLTQDPMYYVSVGGAAAVVSIGVHADPGSRAVVSGNCFVTLPTPNEALGVLLLTSASVYFEPDDGVPTCQVD